MSEESDLENVIALDSNFARATKERQGDRYGDPSSKIWSMYLSEAEKHDKILADNWKGDTDGILIFTGLFSATVAAFIIESYKNLQSDAGATTVTLLGQISLQLAAQANNTHITIPLLPDPNAFQPTSSALRVNILWFLSLVLSLTCALSATLIQQWARRYLMATQRHAIPQKRGQIHAFLYAGVTRYRMMAATEALPALLHTSVLFFFVGLIEFLFSINTTVGWVVLAVVSFGAAVYLLVSLLPLFSFSCPYRTPLSALLRTVFTSLMPGITWSFTKLARRLKTLKPGFAAFLYDVGINVERRKEAYLGSQAGTPEDVRQWTSTNLDLEALRWTLEIIDDDDDLEAFVEGIPGFFSTKDLVLSSEYDRQRETVEAFLSTPGFSNRLTRLLDTCDPHLRVPKSLGGPARKIRALACMQVIRFFTTRVKDVARDDWDETLCDMMWTLYSLRVDEDQDIATAAVCTTAMAARVLLRQLAMLQRLLQLSGLSGMRIAAVLRPLLVLHLRQAGEGDNLEVEIEVEERVDRSTAVSILQDGYLANIAALVRHAMSLVRLAQPGALAVVWDTLNVVIGGDPATQVKNLSPRRRHDFEYLRLEIEAAIEEEEEQEAVDDTPGDAQLLPLPRRRLSAAAGFQKLNDILRPVYYALRTSSIAPYSLYPPSIPLIRRPGPIQHLLLPMDQSSVASVTPGPSIPSTMIPSSRSNSESDRLIQPSS